MLVPVAALAAVVATSPAAAMEGNGWSCISPFANFTNGAYPDDPPAKDHILDSLAISVTRTDSSPLTAVPGQKVALNDLRLDLDFKDTRPAEQMYRRTGAVASSFSGIPYEQTEDTNRTFSLRTNPADNKSYWSYNTGTNAAPKWEYSPEQLVETAGQPPKVRAADVDAKTTWTYATPTLSLEHRYISHTGNSQFPLDAWVTIAASNTVEGVQTIPVKGYWTVNIKDATPGAPGNKAGYNDGPVTATVPPVSLNLATTRWTPTGAGAVEFTVAPPRNMGVVQIESKGYDVVGYNTPLNVRPFGSVYVRAQSESYGSSNDCIPGQISLVPNSGVGTGGLFFGDADPTVPDPALGDPATPGKYASRSNVNNAVGVRGRFAFAYTPLPAIATAPLPAPAPIPQPAPIVGKAAEITAPSTLKPSKAGSVKLSLRNPNTAVTRYKLTAKTVSKYKVGKTKKVVTVAAGKTVSLKPGASDVSFPLSKAAKSLLAKHKSLKVKVTLAPVGGGSTVTKTITLKRS
ncbi:hypothetical protein DVA67_001120 [Solirubrobacter sp. CPCC 204708]|uniref:Uncharacterized protein n=1 Tax=Solirubrobacter deserti TaxID=2282478 RepID=A0ABT4RDF1_9ACTN|nr:hypothetical protein [Solirubrobacter deserti]MBE2314560.1 hypothetical protein [Solirubrobacter deserti]MDA0136564.1 hypothetical protein [Solirubrobacter deserti]